MRREAEDIIYLTNMRDSAGSTATSMVHILKTWKYAAQRRGNTRAKGTHPDWPQDSGCRVQRSFKRYGGNTARPAFM